jgi:hypothetical protein
MSITTRLGIIVIAIGLAVGGTSLSSADAVTQPAAVKAGPPGGHAHLNPPSGWTADGRSVYGYHAVYTHRVQGGSVALMWLDTQLLSLRFIPGTEEPAPGIARAIDKDPSTWAKTMVAAFNGGFANKANHISGFYYNGHTHGTLTRGDGVFVVTNSGGFKVGSWGSSGFTSTSGVLAIRQELLPLIVKNGSAVPTANACADCWGGTDNHALKVRRAAVGVRADGSVVFAYGYDVTARTLALGLVAGGVRNAVVLDMNLTWPTGFVYNAYRFGHRIHPGIIRDPSTYFTPFKRDFVVALPR